MFCGFVVIKNYFFYLKSSIEIICGQVLRVKRVVILFICLLGKGFFEEGMSEYYRNCYFILLKRIDKVDQVVRKQMQRKLGGDLSVGEDFF